MAQPEKGAHYARYMNPASVGQQLPDHKPFQTCDGGTPLTNWRSVPPAAYRLQSNLPGLQPDPESNRKELHMNHLSSTGAKNLSRRSGLMHRVLAVFLIFCLLLTPMAGILPFGIGSSVAHADALSGANSNILIQERP